MSEKENVQQEMRPWHKHPAVLSLLAALGLFVAVVGAINGYEGIATRIQTDIEERAERDKLIIESSEKATTALEISMELQRQFPAIASKAELGYNFQSCWPYSNCDPQQYPSSLPADAEQFQRLDEVEAAFSRLHQFLKKHCQGHRDKQEIFSDCTEL